jgi:hypothetical protein
MALTYNTRRHFDIRIGIASASFGCQSNQSQGGDRAASAVKKVSNY